MSTNELTATILDGILAAHNISLATSTSSFEWADGQQDHLDLGAGQPPTNSGECIAVEGQVTDIARVEARSDMCQAVSLAVDEIDHVEPSPLVVSHDPLLAHAPDTQPLGAALGHDARDHLVGAIACAAHYRNPGVHR